LRDRLEKDCIEFWSERRILEALPDDAKDPKKQKFARLGQKKKISAAETAAPIMSKKTEIMIDTTGKPIENDIAFPSSSDRKEDQLNNKEDLFKFEFSIPTADLWHFMFKLLSWNEDKIWFDVVFDISARKVISSAVGEQTRRIIDEKLQNQ
jgi:hypothetical protein